MPLTSSSIDISDDDTVNLDLEMLVKHVNKHVVAEEYAVNIARIKTSKRK